MRSGQHGFSLIESLVGLAVLAVLLGSAAPSFSGSAQRQHIASAAAQFAGDFHATRTAATARARPLRLDFVGNDSGSGYLAHTGAAGDCRFDAAGRPVCVEGVEAVRATFLPQRGGVRLSTNVPSGSMVVDPYRHTVSPTGSIFIAAEGSGSVRATVNILGRVRLCADRGPVAGYKPC